MQYRELMLATALLLAGTILVCRSSPAHAESEPHHHMMMMDSAADAYQRTVASYEIPDVTLVDENGKESSLRADLSDSQLVMLNFIFTTCTAIAR